MDAASSFGRLHQERDLMGRFRDHLVEEGFFDAVGDGIKAGVKAFNKRRQKDKTRDEKKEIEETILSAKGEELENLLAKIVKNGYSIKDGKVGREVSKDKFLDWLKENVST